DENDVFFFRRALQACHFQGTLRVVVSANEARDYLEGRVGYQDRRYFPLPDLIVTDFKMNGQTGVDFIQWARAQQHYAEIPLVMFSGSARRDDQESAIASGAVAFFSKSGDFT